MTGRSVTAAVVEDLRERMGERDWKIVRSLEAARVLTGAQLERLHFGDLAQPSRGVVRRRVLARLRDWRVVAALDRRIGGVRAGSSGLVFVLDIAGQRLSQSPGDVSRRPWTPGQLFLTHSLAVAELYVALSEHVDTRHGEAMRFASEPGCWWPNGLGGYIKPDAHLELSTRQVADHWWIEVDQGTETISTVRAKLAVYLDFMQRGQLGPGGVMPRVLVSVRDEDRHSRTVELIARLPAPAAELIHATTAVEAAGYLTTALRIPGK